MIKLILSAPVPAMAAAFERVFAGVNDVEVVGKPFETIAEFDCMVSAANSFGLMDGGVDAAITAFFGTQLQARVQKHIVDEYLGEQPVGTAFVIESGDSNHPWLAHAPTMRIPLIIDGTDAVYNATWAALLAIHKHNRTAAEDQKIKSVVFPAMGAGCGQVAPDSVARQMKQAWLNFIAPVQSINWEYARERQRVIAYSCTALRVGTHTHSINMNAPKIYGGCDCGCGIGCSKVQFDYGTKITNTTGAHTHTITPEQNAGGSHNHSINIGTYNYATPQIGTHTHSYGDK